MNLFFLSLFIWLICGLAMLLVQSRKVCGFIFMWSVTTGCLVGLLSVFRMFMVGDATIEHIAWPLAYGALDVGMDFLSAFFLLVFFILTFSAGLFGHAYLRDYNGPRRLGAHYFFYHLLSVSIMLLLVAKNAVLFLAAWELMTISSYFLITFYDHKDSVRRAGYIYLIATHTGTFCLLVMFLMMGAHAGAMNFDQMSAFSFSPGLTAVIFGLALVGFGVKAGFIPFHIWLPHAHPAAPSHVSALLSGVVIKIGIYGLLRVIAIVHEVPSWCGVLILTVGCVSGIGGVLYALGQHEIKTLLAYHSIENIGIIALGIGVGLLGQTAHQNTIVFVGYAGALLHIFNHAVFKGLLFLSAGSLIKSTRTGEINHLGGVLKVLPGAGHLFLIGSLSICGLPLFNGFISEWLVFQSLLRGVFHLNTSGIIASCLAITALALIGGLAAFCFAKAFGTIFLGKPRSVTQRLPEDTILCIPMAMLAAVCLWIGLAPTAMVALSLETVVDITLLKMPQTAIETGILNPLGDLSSVLLTGLVIFTFLSGLRIMLLHRRSLRQAETWNCAYAFMTPRMQYTASSFAEPILRIFSAVVCLKAKGGTDKDLFPRPSQWSSHVVDVSEHALFRPVLNWIVKASKQFNWIQSGHTQKYLLYIFFFLLILLVWKLGQPS